MKRYLVTTGVISAILYLIYFTLNESLFSGYLHPHFPTLVVFFFVQSFAIAWLLNLAEKNPSSSPMFVIASIGFRMITGLFLLLVFYFLKVENIVEFSYQFLGVYLIYFVFEIMVVLANLRRN